MNSLVDKGAVIFLCLISFSTNNNPSETVTAILVSIILSSLGQSFDEKVFTASAVLYFVLCFAQPVFLLVLPVAVFHRAMVVKVGRPGFARKYVAAVALVAHDRCNPRRAP